MKPVTKEELKELLRKDLNKLAEKEYGVVESSKFSNKGSLIDEILKNLKDSVPSEEVKNIEVVEEEVVEVTPVVVSEFSEISNIVRSMKGGAILYFDGKDSISVDNHYVHTHSPRIGDYAKANTDGTVSYRKQG